MRTELERHGHQLILELAALRAWVHGDPTRLTPVIFDLLHDSVKYTPAKGQIRLRLDVDAGQVVVSVGDNGIGIPQEMLAHVFDLSRRWIARCIGRKAGSASASPS